MPTCYPFQASSLNSTREPQQQEICCCLRLNPKPILCASIGGFFKRTPYALQTWAERARGRRPASGSSCSVQGSVLLLRKHGMNISGRCEHQYATLLYRKANFVGHQLAAGCLQGQSICRSVARCVAHLQITSDLKLEASTLSLKPNPKSPVTYILGSCP